MHACVCGCCLDWWLVDLFSCGEQEASCCHHGHLTCWWDGVYVVHWGEYRKIFVEKNTQRRATEVNIFEGLTTLHPDGFYFDYLYVKSGYKDIFVAPQIQAYNKWALLISDSQILREVEVFMVTQSPKLPHDFIWKLIKYDESANQFTEKWGWNLLDNSFLFYS